MAERRLRSPGEGSIDVLPSGSLRVRVYVGIDPMTKRQRYINRVIPVRGQGEAAVRTAKKLARKTLRELLTQVDQKRSPRTSASVNQLIDRWLEVAQLEPSTRRGYLTKIKNHIQPLIGDMGIARLDSETIERYHAELRRCRKHCNGKPYVERHWTSGEHDCAARGADPTKECRWHQCAGLSNSSIRAVHWILSAAFDRAVRWEWLGINPFKSVDAPPLGRPDPHPPSVAEAAALVDRASRSDPEWGTLVWLAMTTGIRRGELCALRWSRIDFGGGVMIIRKAIALGDDNKWYEKDTKTHQKRRITLDVESVMALEEHRRRYELRCESLGVETKPDAFVFSLSPTGETFVMPDTVTQRYGRMCESLGIESNLHALRHYSATELIAAGVDIRTVAGRLGHGGGGATTLRVYAAWVSEADQRAAAALTGRLPPRPRPDTSAE